MLTMNIIVDLGMGAACTSRLVFITHPESSRRYVTSVLYSCCEYIQSGQEFVQQTTHHASDHCLTSWMVVPLEKHNILESIQLAQIFPSSQNTQTAGIVAKRSDRSPSMLLEYDLKKHGDNLVPDDYRGGSILIWSSSHRGQNHPKTSVLLVNLGCFSSLPLYSSRPVTADLKKSNTGTARDMGLYWSWLNTLIITVSSLVIFSDFDDIRLDRVYIEVYIFLSIHKYIRCNTWEIDFFCNPIIH